MALIARIFVVLFAFTAASVVAGLVLTLGLLPPELDELTLMPGAHAGFGLAVALLSWPQAARMSRPRGVRTGEA